MEPILTYSEITGRVYIVTKYRRLDGGVIDAREKFDITDWVESYAKKRNAQTVEENAKLRGLLTEGNEELAKMRRAIDYLYSFAKTCGVDAEDMREMGIEVDG